MPTPTPAPERPFFEGKTVRILIGFPPGGGHDLEARVFSRYLGRYIPGNHTVIVQNMPGAGGIIMATHLYNSKPDGLSIGIFGNTLVLQTLLREEGEIKFDLAKMPAVWTVSGVNVDMVRDFLGVRTAKDLLKVDPSKIVVAGREIRGSSCLKGKLALELLGIKGYKAVCAYAGTAVIRAAMERGEVSFFNGTDAHLVGGGAFADMAKRGLVIPLWQSGILSPEGKIVPSPTVDPKIPTFLEVYREIHGRDPSGPLWEAWKAISIDLNQLFRIYVLPPGTPKDRVETLRQAFKRTAQDPAFVAEWERVFGQKLAPVIVPVERGEQLKKELLGPAPWQEVLRKLVVVKE